MDAIYKTVGENDETMSGAEALELIAKLGARAAPSYSSDDGVYEVYEVYEVGKTAADYPVGDPYADSIWVPVACVAASTLGRCKSPAKAAAAAANGKRGGAPRKRFELTFWGNSAGRYKRYHLDLASARVTAQKVYKKMGWDWAQAHPAIIYGPGLPPGGIR